MAKQQRAPYQVCMERYERSVPWVEHTVSFACQLPRGHEGDHSWEPLRQSDLRASQPEPEPVSGVEISALLVDIDSGEYDPYLENILTVAHERKRALRNRRTYPPLRG
jgi:hypothetical protein